ncbi:MAG: KTSC domain-containing protein [Verrucomicrobiaceae bacterium]|nr:MAG: KTSC domain-containing protein [Verrucomicrobiaceae bacterium]
MVRTPVRSTNLRSVGYDTTTAILEIEFHSGLYQYMAVPERVFQGLMSASSKGSYHDRYIKRSYRYRQLA